MNAKHTRVEIVESEALVLGDGRLEGRPAVGDILYRCELCEHGLGPYTSWRTHMRAYRVIRVTPCGFWIVESFGGGWCNVYERWFGFRTRFVQATERAAVCACVARAQRNYGIQAGRLARAGARVDAAGQALAALLGRRLVRHDGALCYEPKDGGDPKL